MKRNEVLEVLSKSVCSPSIYRFLSSNDWLDDFNFGLHTCSESNYAVLTIISRDSFVSQVYATCLLSLSDCYGITSFSGLMKFQFVFDFHD